MYVHMLQILSQRSEYIYHQYLSPLLLNVAVNGLLPYPTSTATSTTTAAAASSAVQEHENRASGQQKIAGYESADARFLDLSIIVNIVTNSLKMNNNINCSIFDELLYYCILYLQPFYRVYILTSRVYLDDMCIYTIHNPLVAESIGIIERAWVRYCRLKRCVE